MSDRASTASATLEFLRWLAVRPRTYSETMEAWQTSCPRFSVWEDSLDDRLICVQARRPFADSLVTLTAQGRSVLDGAVRITSVSP